MEYKFTSPYVNVGYEAGPLSVDASFRQDRQQATGTANIATASAANGGALRYDPATDAIYRLQVESQFVFGGR